MSSSSEKEDYYSILEVDEAADNATLSASYRRLAKLRHPDKNQNDPNATARFQKLNEAFSVLSDEQKRLAYDRERHITQPKSSHRIRQRKFFYTFHVNPAWAGIPSQSARVVRPPPARWPWSDTRHDDDNLEAKIQQVRRQINDYCASIAEYGEKQTVVAQELEAVWNQIHSLNVSLHQQYDAGGPVQCFELHGSPSLEELWTTTHADPNALPSTHLTFKAHLHLGDAIARSRDIALQITHLTRCKTEAEKKLHELCKRWRAREFSHCNNPDDETWAGWDGWCGWGEGETAEGTFSDGDQDRTCWRADDSDQQVYEATKNDISSTSQDSELDNGGPGETRGDAGREGSTTSCEDDCQASPITNPSTEKEAFIDEFNTNLWGIDSDGDRLVADDTSESTCWWTKAAAAEGASEQRTNSEREWQGSEWNEW